MKTRAITFIALIAIAAAQVVGCGNTIPQDENIASIDAELVWVDAALMDTLEENELFTIDMSIDRLVYAVDLAEVDTSRIEVRDTDQPTILLSTLIDEQATDQGYQGEALERIVLTARTENFASLAAWEVAILNDEGYYVAETELLMGADEALGSVEGATKIEIYFITLAGWAVCIKIDTKKAADDTSITKQNSDEKKDSKGSDDSIESDRQKLFKVKKAAKAKSKK